MRPESIGKIVKQVSETKNRDDKISILREQNKRGPVLQNLLRMGFDSHIKWALPEGAPEYKPCEVLDNEGMLYKEYRRMYLFLEGGHPNLKTRRREQLYKELLECVTPEDATFLIAVKDKTVSKVYKGITHKLIEEAFPA